MGLGAEMTEVPKVPQPDPPGVASFIHRATVRSVQALTSLSLLEPESANDGWWKPKSCNHHGSPGCLGLDPGQGPAVSAVEAVTVSPRLNVEAVSALETRAKVTGPRCQQPPKSFTASSPQVLLGIWRLA